ncbi:MAG: c-type cytochrome [Janthinobacterium lividum]
MPYPSYARIKPDDVKALYAYFIHGVAPVSKSNVKSDIPWPMSARWPLTVWRKTFAPAVATDDASSNSASDPVVRGRYLVQGLGHCSACHTPRGVAFQERALTDQDGALFLSGGIADGWSADNLHPDAADGLGGWSDKDLVEFLKTGRNAHSAAFGAMAEVVRYSTQYLSDEDLFAISSYLKSLPLSNGAQRPLVSDGARAKALYSGDVSLAGARTFVNSCAACHRTNGEGYEGVFPRLALSAAVNAADPTSLIHIVLTGSRMPSTKNAPAAFAMPDFAGRLTDQQIADVVTFVRQSWGNKASAINVGQVAKIRKDLKP